MRLLGLIKISTLVLCVFTDPATDIRGQKERSLEGLRKDNVKRPSEAIVKAF